MKWEKKGLIFKPDGSLIWSQTHAQIPTPVQFDDQTIRVFFATRNGLGETQTGYVDVDIEDPAIVKKIAKQPVIEIGRPGLHDDAGAMPFCVLSEVDKGFKFYYTGWHIPNTVAYDLSIALSVSDNLDSFSKFSTGPLVSKNIYEPYWAAAPCVIKDDGKYKMWYISCYDWVSIDGKLEPVYNIKYAESLNGINWLMNDEVAIPTKFENEALGRPWVIKENNTYKMWYSSRGSNGYRERNGDHYTIGYAESNDGINWKRLDDLSGLNVSDDGWDSEMIEYASVFVHKNKKYMFYNGNGFGKSGFGYAEAEF